MMKEHYQSIEKMLSEQIERLSEQTSITIRSFGELNGYLSDIQSTQLPDDSTKNQLNNRELLRKYWHDIKEYLEELAANSDIDGRTRAKYMRIDRRNYVSLIEVLDNDNKLGRNGKRFNEAAELWQRFKNGRRMPSENDAEKMRALAAQLVPSAE